MPLSRESKESLVESYQGGVATAPNVFLVKYQGITVPQVTDLRTRVRESGGHYEVVKNRIVLRVIDGSALEGLKEHFEGPTAVAYNEDDPVALAKVLTDFAKEVPAIEFKAGLVDGQVVEAEEVKQIAKLPSREELIAKLLFLLQSPITGFVRVLAALPREFVTVLEQVRQEKEKQEAGG
ncbi:MAG: 50S ribosomal protein L10 [Acidobacteria bacterium]|nr:MAG: 50S ribosomal protein L10 [Acidobacteriota bacterium]